MIIKLKGNRGFTLIELLVVISIIGLLSSITLASLSSARAKSRDATRISTIKQLQIALELYRNDFGIYPGSTSWYDNGCNSIYTDINTILAGYYSLPRDPGTACMLFTLENGITPANGVVLKYYIIVAAESAATLARDMDCFVPATHYCVGLVK